MAEESVLFPEDFTPPDERPIKDIPFCGDMMSVNERKARIKLDEVNANLTSAETQLATLGDICQMLDNDATTAVDEKAREKAEQELEAKSREQEAWEKNFADLTKQKEKLEPIIAEAEIPRLKEQELVRLLLERAGIETGQQIMDQGCTGLYKRLLEKKLFDNPAAAQERARWVHLNLGGSGLGLTCYVPLTRYCLVHGVIGGLQEEQASQFADQVPLMSRELEPKEKGHVAFIEAARRRGGADTTESMQAAKEMLAGRKIPDDVPIVSWGGETEGGLGIGGPMTSQASAEDNANVALDKINETLKEVGMQQLPAPWKCPEHSKTIWSCRFCIAQAIIDGPLVPRMVLENVGETKPFEIPSEDVDKRMAESEASQMRLYAQVASWSRRLARDEEPEE